jgi:hypothetical protein
MVLREQNTDFDRHKNNKDFDKQDGNSSIKCI